MTESTTTLENFNYEVPPWVADPDTKPPTRAKILTNMGKLAQFMGLGTVARLRRWMEDPELCLRHWTEFKENYLDVLQHSNRDDFVLVKLDRVCHILSIALKNQSDRFDKESPDPEGWQRESWLARVVHKIMKENIENPRGIFHYTMATHDPAVVPIIEEYEPDEDDPPVDTAAIGIHRIAAGHCPRPSTAILRIWMFITRMRNDYRRTNPREVAMNATNELEIMRGPILLNRLEISTSGNSNPTSVNHNLTNGTSGQIPSQLRGEFSVIWINARPEDLPLEPMAMSNVGPKNLTAIQSEITTHFGLLSKSLAIHGLLAGGVRIRFERDLLPLKSSVGHGETPVRIALFTARIGQSTAQLWQSPSLPPASSGLVPNSVTRSPLLAGNPVTSSDNHASDAMETI